MWGVRKVLAHCIARVSSATVLASLVCRMPQRLHASQHNVSDNVQPCDSAAGLSSRAAAGGGSACFGLQPCTPSLRPYPGASELGAHFQRGRTG